jgi:hypothetical protein
MSCYSHTPGTHKGLRNHIFPWEFAIPFQKGQRFPEFLQRCPKMRQRNPENFKDSNDFTAQHLGRAVWAGESKPAADRRQKNQPSRPRRPETHWTDRRESAA